MKLVIQAQMVQYKSIRISVFGGVNYSLNGAGFQSSNIYNGLVASTYTVIAKDASGCTISSLVAVNSSPLPIVTYSTDPESCSLVMMVVLWLQLRVLMAP